MFLLFMIYSCFYFTFISHFYCLHSLSIRCKWELFSNCVNLSLSSTDTISEFSYIWKRMKYHNCIDWKQNIGRRTWFNMGRICCLTFSVIHVLLRNVYFLSGLKKYRAVSSHGAAKSIPPSILQVRTSLWKLRSPLPIILPISQAIETPGPPCIIFHVFNKREGE